MVDFYCDTCGDYTGHENSICSICGSLYNHNKKRYVIAGQSDNPEVIKAKEDFIKEHPGAIVISEDIALKHRMKGFSTKPSEEFDQQKKYGRNDPCPCGSGKKYKKCCINK